MSIYFLIYFLVDICSTNSIVIYYIVDIGDYVDYKAIAYESFFTNIPFTPLAKRLNTANAIY